MRLPPGPDLALLPELEGRRMVSAWLSFREHGDYLVAALRGELDAADAGAFGAALAAAAAANPRIVVDLTRLEYIDCCALSMLARVRAQARGAGGDLLLAGPGPLVRRVLELAAMSADFAVRASVAEAAHGADWPGARPHGARAAVTSPAAGEL